LGQRLAAASGDGQIITYSAFSDSTRAFDGHGNLIPVPDYQ